MIFFGADNKKIVADAMGALRLKVGKDLGLTDESKWAPRGLSTSRCLKTTVKAA
ncbi:hypothetical protein ACLB1R_07000 [Escherichia coli]